MNDKIKVKWEGVYLRMYIPSKLRAVLKHNKPDNERLGVFVARLLEKGMASELSVLDGLSKASDVYKSRVTELAESLEKME